MKLIHITVIAAFLVILLPGRAVASTGSNGGVKSASEIKQKLDSILLSSWDSAGARWNLAAKSDYTYDMTGKLVLSFGYGWTSSTMQWRPRTKFECNYDFLGLLSSTVSYIHDTTPGTWKPDTKHEYLFDPDKNISQDIQLNWSSDSSSLIYSSKIDYSYNLSGRLTSVLMSIVNSLSQWQPLTQSNFTYDSLGNFTLETALVMNLQNHHWYPAYRNEHTYDTAGNRIRTIYSTAVNDSALWQLAEKNEFVYNNMNKMILETDYQFSVPDSLWINHTREERTYSDNGDMLIKYDYFWDQGISEWVPVSGGKMVCDYNTAFTISQLILPEVFENYNSDHLMIDKFQYRWNGSDWTQASTNSYYFSEKNLGLPENSLAYCQVYPNPAGDHVSIDWPGLKGELLVSIYNMNGAMVFSRMLPAQTTISFGNLPAGEYILKIIGDQKATATRLVIR